MTWRRWIWLGLLAGAAVIAWGAASGLGAWRLRGELRQAREEIDRGRIEPARRRLAALAAQWPGALGGEVDYWLGVCEATRGHQDAALAAFARVPEHFPFDARAAYLEAAANLQRGRLRAAERRLEPIVARGGSGLDALRSLLVRVYQIEVRMRDVARILRDGWPTSRDRLAALKELVLLDRGGLPRDRLRSALEEAGHLAPDDDRVWLGRGRLAILSGDWDEAAVWLERCLARTPDEAVWRAWLDWALGAGRPDEVLQALRHLDPEHFDPAERLSLRGWFARQRHDSPAERSALTQALEAEPSNPRILERLAELAHESGETAQVVAFRHRKAEVDRALDRYRRNLDLRTSSPGADDRLEMARLAKDAGRVFDARAWCALALEADPRNRQAQELLERLGHEERPSRPPVKVADPWADLGPWDPARPDTRTAPSATSIHFEDEAEATGIRFTYVNGESPLHQIPETTGGGVALLDYDGDGWIDVYAVQGGHFPPGSEHPNTGDRLFRNRGDGTFEDATERAGLAGSGHGYGHGVAVGDIDNDGFQDLFVTRWRSYAVYRNLGDGTFADVTVHSDLGGDRDWPTSAALADLDGDGDLDLYVCHYAEWDAENPRICRQPDSNTIVSCNPIDVVPRPDHLFRNDAGRFVDVTEEAGVLEHSGRGLGVLAADLDDDGRLDLFVANDMSANFLWRNLGGMRFEEVGHSAGVAANAGGGYQAGMGVAAGDLDGDGHLDLTVTNFYGESTSLYRGLGGGLFADATVASGLAAASRHLLGFGVAFLDADNDGRLDLATANGHVNDFRPHFPYRMPAQLLQGGEGGRLTDVSRAAGPPWQVPRMGRGLAAGDLDNDGRVDLLIVSQNQPLAYFHNQTSGGHWIGLQLAGARSNRDGVGARITLNVSGRRQVAHRIGGGSYESASDPGLHLGLGRHDRVDAIEVTWPSGRIDRFRDLPADAVYLLREGRPAVGAALGAADRTGPPPTSLSADRAP